MMLQIRIVIPCGEEQGRTGTGRRTAVRVLVFLITDYVGIFTLGK